jgi:hypothetical protein
MPSLPATRHEFRAARCKRLAILTNAIGIYPQVSTLTNDFPARILSRFLRNLPEIRQIRR